MEAHEILIPLLALVAVTATGAALLVRRGRTAAAMRVRIADSEQQVVATSVLPTRGAARSFERAAKAVSFGSPSPKLREQLARAGYYSPNAGSVYLGLKTLIFLTSVAGLTSVLLPLGFAPAPTMGIVFGGAAALSFIPNIVVRAKRVSRANDMRQHLPDALDLLEICVSSGMGLDAAWNSVSDEVRGVSTALADEMALTSLQLRLGGTRSVAMRERRSQNAAEAAEKTAVKLLFPMVLFIFPVVFVVTVGPAAVQIYKMFSSGQL